MTTDLETQLANALRLLTRNGATDRTAMRVCEEALAVYQEAAERAIIEDITDDHTAGPWAFEPPSRLYTSAISVVDGDGKQVCSVRYRLPPGTARANALRIVACINACEGIVDPAAFVEAARAVSFVTSGDGTTWAEELREADPALLDALRALEGSL